MLEIDKEGHVTRCKEHVADIIRCENTKYPEEGSSFQVNIRAECNKPQDFWAHEIRELLEAMERVEHHNV